MHWTSENIDFGKIGIPDPTLETGYQKQDLVKRANAFAHIFNPVFLKKIRDCQDTGNYEMARIHFENYKSKFKRFLEIVIKAENAKAYCLMQDTLLVFLKKLGITKSIMRQTIEGLIK